MIVRAAFPRTGRSTNLKTKKQKYYLKAVNFFLQIRINVMYIYEKLRKKNKILAQMQQQEEVQLGVSIYILCVWYIWKYVLIKFHRYRHNARRQKNRVNSIFDEKIMGSQEAMLQKYFSLYLSTYKDILCTN